MRSSKEKTSRKKTSRDQAEESFEAVELSRLPRSQSQFTDVGFKVKPKLSKGEEDE